MKIKNITKKYIQNVDDIIKIESWCEGIHYIYFKGHVSSVNNNKDWGNLRFHHIRVDLNGNLVFQIEQNNKLIVKYHLKPAYDLNNKNDKNERNVKNKYEN